MEDFWVFKLRNQALPSPGFSKSRPWDDGWMEFDDFHQGVDNLKLRILAEDYSKGMITCGKATGKPPGYIWTRQK